MVASPRMQNKFHAVRHGKSAADLLPLNGNVFKVADTVGAEVPSVHHKVGVISLGDSDNIYNNQAEAHLSCPISSPVRM